MVRYRTERRRFLGEAGSLCGTYNRLSNIWSSFPLAYASSQEVVRDVVNPRLIRPLIDRGGANFKTPSVRAFAMGSHRIARHRDGFER